MIVLEMYLDGKLIDTATPCRFLQRNKYSEHLKSLVAELEKKHTHVLLKSASKPAYMLSGVQSCMNHFTLLCHQQQALPDAPIEKPFPACNEVRPPRKKEKLQAVGNTPYKHLTTRKAKNVA